MQQPTVPQGEIDAVAAAALRDEAERLNAVRRTGLLDSAKEEAYDAITELGAGICGVPVCLITLVEASRQWFKSVYGSSCREMRREDSICQHLLQQDEPLLIPDLLLDARFVDRPVTCDGATLRSYAGVPIRGPEGHRLGSLCVVDLVPRAFTEAQIRALKSLALQVETQIALRMEVHAKNELMRLLDESHRRFELFMDNSPIAAFMKDQDGRLRWYNRCLAEIYGVTTEAWLGKLDAEIWPAAEAERFRRADERVLAGGEGLTVEECAVGPDGTRVHWKTSKFSFTDSKGAKFLAGVAVNVTQENRRQEELNEVTRQLRTANEELHRITMVDELTQIGNRRSFDHQLALNYVEARQEAKGMALILLDVDHFKCLNDKHGHAYGDEVLRQIGDLLQRSLRGSDRVCRYGGEEFVILLQENSPEEALRLAMRVCARTRAHAFPHGRVTLSAGVAVLRDETTRAGQITAEADAALYRAKHLGRDRAVLYEADDREGIGPCLSEGEPRTAGRALLVV